MFAGAYLLFSGRKTDSTRIKALLDIWPDFYQHISNFTISYILYSGIGFMWLMLGVQFKLIVGLGLLVLLCNFVYEMWIPILNTPDMVDAYYGFTGTVLAFVFLLITKEYGLRPVKIEGGA